MIDIAATVGTVAAVRAGAPPRPPQPGEVPRRREAAAAENSDTPAVPETQSVARKAAEEQGRYQVRIHSETMRVITEIVDMVTGDTLMYLPAGYRPDAEHEAKPAADRKGDAGSTP